MANPEYFGSEVDATDTYCTFTIKRKKSNGVIDSRTVTFTLQQAEKAGLLAKEGSNYKKYPMRMLKARAQAYACRDLFSDVIANIYTPEELEEVAYPIKPDYSVEDVEQPKEPNKIVIAEKYNLIKNWLYHDIPLVSSLKEAYLLRANTALSEKNLDALETIIKELKTRLEDMKNAKRANKPALAVPDLNRKKPLLSKRPPRLCQIRKASQCSQWLRQWSLCLIPAVMRLLTQNTQSQATLKFQSRKTCLGKPCSILQMSQPTNSWSMPDTWLMPKKNCARSPRKPHSLQHRQYPNQDCHL